MVGENSCLYRAEVRSNRLARGKTVNEFEQYIEDEAKDFAAYVAGFAAAVGDDPNAIARWIA
jgi:hypothetical protein